MRRNILNFYFFVKNNFKKTIPIVFCSLFLLAPWMLSASSLYGYICPGDSLSCGSFSAVYEIYQTNSGNFYVCNNDSLSCDSSNAVYQVKKDNSDTYYVCSGDSTSCSFLNDIYTVDVDDEDTMYVCEGDSITCGTINDVYKVELVNNTNEYEYNYYNDLCPENATYQNGKCACNSGYYVINSETDPECVSIDGYCKETYGNNSYGSNGKCYCETGYEFSSNDQCILSQQEDKSDFSSNQNSISNGALIKAKGGVDVYIVKYVGSKKFKRLILSPSVFNNYGHLSWGDIIEVDQSVVDSFTTSNLVKAVGDDRIYRLYPQGDTGKKRWIKTSQAFNRNGWDWDAVYEINQFDRNSYITGNPVK